MSTPTTSTMTATISTPTNPDRLAPAASDPRVAGYLAAILDEGDRFATAAERGDLAAPVRACPGWDVRELVRHLGLVHLWAAANIRFPSDRWLSVDGLSDLAPYWPDLTHSWPPDAELVGWYRSTLALLVEVIGSAPAEHRCLTFLPAPTPMIMWARRQASEIAVHRYDVEAARGIETRFEPAFALDLLDELLAGFAPHMRTVDATEARTIHVEATDMGAEYWMTLGPGKVRTERSGGRADLRLSGTATGLALLLWNRPAAGGVEIDGDRDVLDVWSETCRVRWL